MTKRRQFTASFKAQVVLEVLSGHKTMAEIARQHHIKPEIIARWRRQFLENAASVFEKSPAGNGEAEARVAERRRLYSLGGWKVDWYSLMAWLIWALACSAPSPPMTSTRTPSRSL